MSLLEQELDRAIRLCNAQMSCEDPRHRYALRRALLVDACWKTSHDLVLQRPWMRVAVWGVCGGVLWVGFVVFAFHVSEGGFVEERVKASVPTVVAEASTASERDRINEWSSVSQAVFETRTLTVPTAQTVRSPFGRIFEVSATQ